MRIRLILGLCSVIEALAIVGFSACHSGSLARKGGNAMGGTPAGSGGIVAIDAGGWSTGGTYATGGNVRTGGSEQTGGNKATGGMRTGGIDPSTGGDIGRSSGSGGSCCYYGGTTATGGRRYTDPVTTTLPNGHYQNENEVIRFEVDPALGARLVGLALKDGQNVLADEFAAGAGHGTTFEFVTDKGLSTIPEFNILPFTMGTRSNLLWGESPKSVSGILRRQYQATVDRTIVIEYAYKPDADAAAPVHVAETTRLVPGGITFFPTGKNAPTSGSLAMPTLQNTSGCTWIEHPLVIATPQRIVAETSGEWVAYVTADGAVLVKTFPDIPSSELASGQGEIAVSFDVARKFVTLETYGRFVSARGGEWNPWRTAWHLGKLPTTTSVMAGSQSLVSFVHQTIGRY